MAQTDPVPDPCGPLTPDRERWAEALMVQRIHGSGAERFIAERIEVLSRAGDRVGVARWDEIAARLSRLRSPGVVQ